MTAIFSKVAFAPCSPLRLTSSTSTFLSPLAASTEPAAQRLLRARVARRFAARACATPPATLEARQSPDPAPGGGSDVRVRFAPSPTGTLHVGGARTALYNWLLARQTGGRFVIRVEDTDLARSTRESEDAVLSDLRWLGLQWDEGPGHDAAAENGESSVGPFRQSERGDLYKQYAQRLVADGLAYPCFCSEEELEAKRQQMEAEGRPPQYDGTWRDADPAEVQRRLDAGEEHTIRFRVPDGSRVVIDDVVRGKIAWDANATVGDFILLRSNGVPVYNFCVAVDDALMRISTVIRAEEHLTNTLRQVLILEALGFAVPRYAHCSLILGSDRSKLSKRHGATSVTQFKEEGYLPQAMVNYLAALGWNDGSEKEIYSVDELVQAFDITRITKSPAMFDADKLRFINGQHLRALPLPEIQPLLVTEWVRAGIFADGTVPVDNSEQPADPTAQRLAQVAISLVHGSIDIVSDANQQMLDVLAYPLRETVAGEEATELIADEGGFKELSACVLRDYDAGVMPVGKDAEEHPAVWKKWVKAVGKETGRKGKRLFHPLRLALTGSMSGPDVGSILELLYLSEKLEAAPSIVPLNKRIDTLKDVLSTL